jgi:M6 family metalloprotease-like protein
MRASDLFEESIKKSRRFINPPYSIKEIYILVGTLIVLLAIPLTVISINQARDPGSRAVGEGKAAKISRLTKTLNDLSADYVTSKKSSLVPKMHSTARERKQLLLEVIETKPATVLNNALSKKVRDKLPPKVQKLTEEQVDLKGTLEVLHEDDFENQKSREFHFLSVGKKKYSLHTSDQFPHLLSSSKVRVIGIKLDDKIAFTTKDTLEVLEEAQPDSIGEQRTVVILANFQNTNEPDLTHAEVYDVVFSQVNDFYLEASYGKTWFSGDIFGWYTMPIDYICDPYTTRIEAIEAADPDVDFTQYSRLVIVLATYCKDGQASLGKYLETTDDGEVLISTAWINSRAFGRRVVGHELGHNLGLHHASFLKCGDAAITDDCTVSEYGDRYDIMGSPSTGHMNAPHKEGVGWFEDSNILEVTESGIYTIEPIETATAGLKALKIRRAPEDYLYVEYRQPIGEDTGLDVIPGTDVFEGALLHTLATPIAYKKTLILDMSPPESSIYCLTPALHVGNSFTDPATGTTVTVTDRVGSSLTVDVTIGTLDTDNDGFSNFNELLIGTDPLDDCGPDAWPPDFNNDRVVNIVDLNQLLPPPLGVWGLTADDPNWSPRHDLYPDGVINIVDLNKLLLAPLGAFGTSCTD